MFRCDEPSHSLDLITNYLVLYAQENGYLITNSKLQKLLYFAQGWYLALYDTCLFNESIEAHIQGPVIPAVFDRFECYKFDQIKERISCPSMVLSKQEIEHLNDIIDEYGKLDECDLEQLAYQSDPWIYARKNIAIDEASNTVIKPADLKVYFQKKLKENINEGRQYAK